MWIMVGLGVVHANAVACRVLHIGLYLPDHGLEGLEAISVQDKMALKFGWNKALQDVHLYVFRKNRSVSAGISASLIQPDGVQESFKVLWKFIKL